MRKYSILSLALISVSAIAAAFVPKMAAAENEAVEGILQPSTNPNGMGDITCAPGFDGEACTYTQTSQRVPGISGSSTTGGGANTNSNTAVEHNQTLSITTVRP